MTKITLTEELTVTSCWCGIHLAIPDNLYRVAQDEGKGVFCPIGHTFVFTDTFKEKYEKEQERVREQARRTKAAVDLLHAEERSHAATRGSLTKLKKRVHAGVCTECNRSFANLARHMKSKHGEECEAK